MTCLAEKKVESRVRNISRARDMAEEGVPRPFAVTDWKGQLDWRLSASEGGCYPASSALGSKEIKRGKGE
jgi:hypothetical protein